MKEAAILAISLVLLAACGAEETPTEGTIVVEPGRRTTLSVSGEGRVAIELDGRGPGNLELQPGGGRMRTLASAGSYRIASEGTVKVVLSNPNPQDTLVHYRATGGEPVTVTVSRD